VLRAPFGKRWTFVFASGYISWDDLATLDTKRLELSRRSPGRVFVRDASPDELTLHYCIRIFTEKCNPSRHSTVNKVRSFEHSGAVGVDHHDDGVGGFDAIIDNNQRPARRPQNRLPNDK
jgi:hypothetical protein